MSDIYANDLNRSIDFTIGEKILVKLNKNTYSIDHEHGVKTLVVITGWYRNYYIGEVKCANGDKIKVTIHKTDLLTERNCIRRIK